MKKTIFALLVLISLVITVVYADESLDTYYKKESPRQFPSEYLPERNVGWEIVNCLDNGYLINPYKTNTLIKTNTQITIEWYQNFNSVLASICKTVPIIEGGYFIAGQSVIDKKDICIIRLDDKGTIMWQKSLEGSKDDYVNTIIPSSSGGIIICGSTASNDGDFSGNKGQHDMFAVKMDFDSNIEWTKTYGGSNDDGCSDGIRTNDGGFLLCGDTQSRDGDINAEIPGCKDGLFIKLDSNGNDQWSKVVGFPDKQEYLKEVIEDNDGYVAIGSQSDDYRSLIYKIDFSGNIIWSYLNVEQDSFFNHIFKLENGNYIVFGNRITFFNQDGKIEFQNDKYKCSAIGRSNVGGLIENKISDFLFTPYKPTDSKYRLSDKTQYAKSDNEINVVLNNQVLSFDQKPVLENDRTLVPMRKIFESLNARVDWDEETKTATIQKDTMNVIIKIDGTNATVNGNTVKMDVAAKIINDRTLVPLRFISETLGLSVEWDSLNQIIFISNPDVKQDISSEDIEVPKTIQDICFKSLVQVECIVAGGGPKKSYAGYAVNYKGKNVVLTNLSSIISNKNVDKVKITFQDGRTFENYKMIGFDLDKDIAMIECKLDNLQLPTFKEGNFNLTEDDESYIITLDNGTEKAYSSKISDNDFTQDNSKFIKLDKTFTYQLTGALILKQNGDVIGITSARNSNKFGSLLVANLNEINIITTYPLLSFRLIQNSIFDMPFSYEEEEPNEIYTYNTHVLTVLPNSNISGVFNKPGDLDLYIVGAEQSCELSLRCRISASNSNINIEDVIDKIHMVLEKKEVVANDAAKIIFEGKKVKNTLNNTWELEIKTKINADQVAMYQVDNYYLKVYCDPTDDQLEGISYVIDYNYQ